MNGQIKRDISLYMRIIKKENNPAVMRDVVIDGINPYMRRMIENFAKKNRKAWEREAIFLPDIREYAPNFDGVYSKDAVFKLEKLKTFIQNLPKDPKSLADETQLEKLEFKDLDLDKLDTAAIIKILRHRRPQESEKFYQCLRFVCNKLSILRNQYEGHLDESVKTQCSTEVLIEEVEELQKEFASSVKKFDELIRFGKLSQEDCQTAKDCKQVVSRAERFIAQVKMTLEDISGCKLVKDSAIKYTAENLLAYHVFVVYPNARSDKFRRFCNDSLRVYHALKGSYIYTDTGTVSRLEALSICKDPERRFEAKQIQKTLFEPMLRGKTLRVLRPEEESKDRPDEDFINIDRPCDEDLFLQKLEEVNGNVCIITDDLNIADKVWQLNANADIKTFSAVAVRAVDKINVVPYYK